MLEASDLIRLQAELEYGVTISDGIIPVTVTNTADVPRVSAARHAEGYVVYFRDDLPRDLREQLIALDMSELFANHNHVCELLAEITPCDRVIDCRWYAFDRIPDLTAFPDVTVRDGRFIVIIAGETAAAAWSAQENDTAAEVEVETLPDFRQRGYGRQVVAAWAHHTQRAGKIAFYSHRCANVASEALARSVGATSYADTIEYM